MQTLFTILIGTGCFYLYYKYAFVPDQKVRKADKKEQEQRPQQFKTTIPDGWDPDSREGYNEFIKNIAKNLTLVVIIIFIACSPRPITGTITDVSGRVVTLDNGRKFEVQTDTARVGQTVTFTPTRNRKKVNSKKLD